MITDRDADFSEAVLRDLYAYPRKRAPVAWVLWLLLGWAGAHRFYLHREFTGLAMLFTGGGSLLWWAADGFFVNRMLRAYNADQQEREAAGRPPLELDAMPPLDSEALARTPEWVERRRARGAAAGMLGIGGDVLVLVVAAFTLGGLARSVDGGLEAAVAVLLLAGVTVLGSGPAWLEELPAGRGLQHWAHKLRLFYRYNPPGPPLLLLIRPVTGILTAPFRAVARTEVRLYVELGAVFTGLFLLLEVVPQIVWPALLPGREVELAEFLSGWIGEVLATFFLVYAFATPVGAILNRHLLIRDTHRVPRLLAGVTLLTLALAFLGS